MELIGNILVIMVALEHLYFLVLEMFLWTKPKGMRTFGLKSKDFAEDTKVLAANQGLYNGFLAAGLLYSLAVSATNFVVFFLVCVTIAGIYGSYSTKKVRLFYVQSVPALLALVTIILKI